MTVTITNSARIKDYRSILGNTITIITGYDEKISLHDSNASILKKTINAGQGFIIEDTTLTTAEDIYDTITNPNDFNHNEKAVWKTKIAYHSGYMIHFFEGILYGHIEIDPSIPAEKLLFGDIFIPVGYKLSVTEIENKKDLPFKNARQLALTKLLLGESYHVEMLK